MKISSNYNVQHYKIKSNQQNVSNLEFKARIKVSKAAKTGLIERIKKSWRVSNVRKFGKTHLDHKTVRYLDKCSLQEYVDNVYKILCKNFGVSEELCPTLFIGVPGIDPKCGAIYDFLCHTIQTNPKYNNSRLTLFSFIKHEFMHLIQNFQILRTEGLGEKAVQKYAKLKTTLTVENFIKQYSSITERELKEWEPQLGGAYIWVKELMEAVKEGPQAVEKFKAKIIENDYNIHLNELNEFRQKIINQYGRIPAESKEARTAEVYFNDFIKNYKDKTSKEAQSSLSEVEASMVQRFTLLEYLFHRFF